MTIQEFVADHGSYEAAARKIGVSLHTVYRWVKGYTRPMPLVRKRLKALGVEVD